MHGIVKNCDHFRSISELLIVVVDDFKKNKAKIKTTKLFCICI